MTQAAEKCCECGSTDVRYHNYREQPFCWPCADGRGPDAPAPEQPTRHTADSITSDALDRLYAELDAAKQFARLCAKDTEKALKRAQRAELRADLLQGDVDTLRGGLREIGADPTQIQNLWAQISLRNRQWQEEKYRAEKAEAAIERVRDRHPAGADGRCETCGVRWPCPDVCRLNTPPGCRNCGEWHSPLA